MIIIITGGIGSGKTLSAIKYIVDRNTKLFTNFHLNGIPHQRIKFSHLFIKYKDDNKKDNYRLNYEFWNEEIKKGGFDIYLDEFHNIMGSRRAMSKRNIVLSDWLSQIRKILGASEKHNLYLITQKLRRIDVNSRDLAELCLKCIKQEFKDVLIPTEINEMGKYKVKRLPLTIVYKYYFPDADALSAFELYGVDTCIKKTRFIGNPYFKYFNSYELVDFGSEEYL